jgi:hypothetical protein
MSAAVGVGSPVWVFDENHRIYAKDANGKCLGGGPIWREHWVKQSIRGETSRSWLTNFGRKIPKKNWDVTVIAFDTAAIDEQAFVHNHRYRISGRVASCYDAVALRTIAAIVGYDITEPTR